jgi:hypothetical protein
MEERPAEVGAPGEGAGGRAQQPVEEGASGRRRMGKKSRGNFGTKGIAADCLSLIMARERIPFS